MLGRHEGTADRNTSDTGGGRASTGRYGENNENAKGNPDGEVSRMEGWELNGGCAAQGINNFCRELGITRSDSVVHLHKLDFHVRADLDAVSPRCLAVLRPLRLTLTNLPASFLEHVPAKVGGRRADQASVAARFCTPCWPCTDTCMYLAGAWPVLRVGADCPPKVLLGGSGVVDHVGIPSHVQPADVALSVLSFAKIQKVSRLTEERILPQSPVHVALRNLPSTHACHLVSTMPCRASRQLRAASATAAPCSACMVQYECSRCLSFWLGRLQVFPGRSEDTYELPLTRTVYIEQTDFRERKAKDYYGLALDQPAMLKCVSLTRRHLGLPRSCVQSVHVAYALCVLLWREPACLQRHGWSPSHLPWGAAVSGKAFDACGKVRWLRLAGSLMRVGARARIQAFRLLVCVHLCAICEPHSLQYLRSCTKFGVGHGGMEPCS